MRKFTKVVLGVMLAVSLLVGPAFAYDKEKPEKNPIELGWNASFSYPKIAAFGTAVGFTVHQDGDRLELREGYWSQGGCGVVVAPGIIFTAAHVISPDTISLPKGKVSSRVTASIGMTSRTVLILDYKDDPIIGTVLYESASNDLAVIKFDPRKNYWMHPVPYAISPTPERGLIDVLSEGDAVCGVVHVRDEDGSRTADVRYTCGTIVSAGPEAPRRHTIAWLNPTDITMDTKIQPGDSGSPIFAFSNGRPVLVGIIRAIYNDGYTYYSYFAQLGVICRFVSGLRG